MHLLVKLPPNISIENCALSLMNNSQHWLGRYHKTALIRAGVDRVWQPSAYAGTCGKVTTAIVKSFLQKGVNKDCGNALRFVGASERSPTCRLGDFRSPVGLRACSLELKFPNLPVGDFRSRGDLARM